MTTLERTAIPGPAVPFSEALAVWIKVGLLSFGGAAGQIAMLHTIVVDEKKWLDEKRFLHALSYCTLLPGPEAQQLATYIGWLMHGLRGGLVAGLLFVLPGALVVLGLSMLYVTARGVPLIDGIFYGVKAAVLVIVAQAVIKMGKRVGHTGALYAIMATAFLAILLFRVPYPAIVLLAALAGALLVSAAPATEQPARARPGRAVATVRTVAIWTAVWWAPVALAAALLGPRHLLTELGVFFSQLAMLTFGGAYALLVWLAQAAVEQKAWVTATEMVDGLGLAETKPGPTILVTQFVGFLAGWRQPEPFTPMVGAVLAAAMTTWVTFAPSFLWIFAGAPYMEDLRANRRLASALQGITAAVVGVILYLAIWFGLHVFFGRVDSVAFGPASLPRVDIAALDWKAAALAIIAFIAAFRLKLGIVPLIGLMAALGIAVRLGLG